MRFTFQPSEVYSPYGREHAQHGHLAAVSKADLRWYYFLGELNISHREVAIGPAWGWIPLFDVIYSVCGMMEFIQGNGGSGRIGFTENAEYIDFSPSGDDVLVQPSYRDTFFTCPAGEIISAGKEFIREGLLYAVSSDASIAENPHLQSLVNGRFGAQ